MLGLDVTSIPRTTDVAHECRVHDEMAERLNEHHVDLAKPTAGLDVNAHLRAITTSALLDPCKVQDTMHGAVGELGSPLLVGAIQGDKAASGSLHRATDHRTLCAPSKLVGKPSAQRRFSAPGDRTFLGGIVPTEHGS